MVNVGRNALSQGEFYPRDNWPRNDRQYMEIQDGRFNTSSVHGYPQVYIPAPIYDTKVNLTRFKGCRTCIERMCSDTGERVRSYCNAR